MTQAGLDEGEAQSSAQDANASASEVKGTAEKWWRNKLPYALAALSGVLYFTGFVDFGVWPLCFVCFVPLLFGLKQTPTLKGAFLVSWCMGTSTFLGGYYWLVHLFRAFAEFPLVAAFPLYVLFCALQGLQFALIGLGLWLAHRRSAIRLGWLLPFALVAGEWLLPLFFKSYLANCLAFVPELIQPADLGGVALVSFIAASTSGALFEVISSRLDRRPFPVAITLFTLGLVLFDVGYSHHQLEATAERDQAFVHVKTAIIQGNVGSSMKHLDVDAGISKFQNLTQEILDADSDIDLVVWPESAFNKIIRRPMNLAGHLLPSVKVPMVIGLLREEAHQSEKGVDLRYFNTVAAIAEGGDIVGLYDKVVLVAFGEYLPGEKLLSPLYSILPFSSSFTHGTSLAPLTLGTWRLSANICYEDILADHVRALMKPNAAGHTPNAMINVTNDSWYGPSEPKIHLALSIFRSVEHRRWLVRSTATGISAFIDSTGKVVAQTPLDEPAALVAQVPMVDAPPTIYGRFGEWLPMSSLAFLLGAICVPRLKRRLQKKASA